MCLKMICVKVVTRDHLLISWANANASQQMSLLKMSQSVGSSKALPIALTDVSSEILKDILTNAWLD